MLLVLILYMHGGTYSLKSTSNDRFFEKLSSYSMINCAPSVVHAAQWDSLVRATGGTQRSMRQPNACRRECMNWTETPCFAMLSWIQEEGLPNWLVKKILFYLPLGFYKFNLGTSVWFAIKVHKTINVLFFVLLVLLLLLLQLLFLLSVLLLLLLFLNVYRT